MPQYNGKEVLTVGKFEQARRVVKDWLAKTYPGVDMPTPYKPGHEGDKWVLTLEIEPDWAIEISQDGSVEWPNGVWVEAVNPWCLGLHPA
jgi:hypothetical protein